jgi:hypothetical protein
VLELELVLSTGSVFLLLLLDLATREGSRGHLHQRLAASEEVGARDKQQGPPHPTVS